MNIYLGDFPVREWRTPNMEMNRASTRGIVLHATGGRGYGLEDEYFRTLSYLMQSGVSASYHILIGPEELDVLVDDQDVAWHAKENNYSHLGVALAQPHHNPGFNEFQYEALAAICSRWGRKYSIPLERVESQYQRGIVEHKDTEQGKREGKLDIGGKFEWNRLLKLMRAYSTDQVALRWSLERALRMLEEGS